MVVDGVDEEALRHADAEVDERSGREARAADVLDRHAHVELARHVAEEQRPRDAADAADLDRDAIDDPVGVRPDEVVEPRLEERRTAGSDEGAPVRVDLGDGDPVAHARQTGRRDQTNIARADAANLHDRYRDES